MKELEIIILILCVINMGLLFYVLFRKNNQGNKLELKQDLKEMTSEIALKMMAQQGELKEHLAKQIGQNNEKMLNQTFEN